jgi:hypothetical protein
MVHVYERKENSSTQNVFQGFKDLGSLFFCLFSLVKSSHELCLDRLSFLMKILAMRSLPQC